MVLKYPQRCISTGGFGGNYRENKHPLTKIRRLHLIVVDLDKTRSVSARVYQDFKECQIPADLAGCLNTLPVPIPKWDCPFRVRFVFAYGVDNSDRPSYLLWPHRGNGGHFWLVDPWSGNFFDPAAARFIAPIGLEHFFDAFALNHMRPLRVDAAAALRLPVDDVSDTLVVKQDRAKMFDLTPVWAPVEPPAKRAKTAEVRLSSTGDVSMTPKKEENEQGSSDEEDSDSSGSNSDVSSEDDTSDVSDLDKFEEAYTDFSALTAGVDPLTLERDGSGHTNDLLEGYCMEVSVTNSSPELQLHFVKKFAKDLVILFALHMAEKISSLLRHVLDHPSKVLYDPETEPLFLPLFWFYPIYRELLNTASRHRPSKYMELRRAASGLVKVICRTVDSRPGGKGKKPGRPRKKDGALVGFSDWFGSMSMMNILYVWFPASWGPSVV